MDFFHRSRLFFDTLSSFDQVIAPSHFLAERFCEWGLEEEKTFVVENGLAHLPQPEPESAARRRQTWTFGFFGQINPFKGVDVILDAAELLKKERVGNVRLRIHGNLIGQTEQFCNRFRDACASGAVEYFGAYDNRTVARLMADCDYVMVPSRWWENSPVVIQEAFGVGRPVLCSGVGGMAEKVKNGVAGLHFRLADPVGLARCIVEAASAETYRKLAKNLPRPFDGAEMARRYLEVFAGEGKKAAAPVVAQDDEIQSITFG
jgi:glycosyltransferase involved in cell wall biosynthesis